MLTFLYLKLERPKADLFDNKDKKRSFRDCFLLILLLAVPKLVGAYCLIGSSGYCV